MKRIYAFTLDSEDYPSSKFKRDLRLVAYLLYNYIYNYDGDGFTALIINDKIRNNDIHEEFLNRQYYLEHDEYNLKYINYEPFLIGSRSFALTIDDDIMSEEVINSLMQQVLLEVSLLSKVNYKYTLRSICYPSKNKEDERNRKKAVVQLHDALEGVTDKKKEHVRKRTIREQLLKRRIGLL